MTPPRDTHEAINSVEVIANLAYLIQLDPADAAAAKVSAAQIEQHAVALGTYIRTLSREAKEVGI